MPEITVEAIVPDRLLNIDSVRLELLNALRSQGREIKRDYAKTVATWSFETTRPLSFLALRQAAQELPDSVYRAKGFFYSREQPGQRGLLQVVGSRVDTTYEPDWGDRTPATHIVFIGPRDGLDPAALTATFEGCIASD